MEISAVAIPGGEGIKAAQIGPCRLVDLAGLRERGQLLKPLDCCNGRRVVNPGHGQHRGVDVKARKCLKRFGTSAFALRTMRLSLRVGAS